MMRAQVKIGLANLARNFTRLAWLIQTQQTCVRAPLISPKILAIHRPRPAILDQPRFFEVSNWLPLVGAGPRGGGATRQQPAPGGSAIQAALGGFSRPSRHKFLFCALMCEIWAFRYFWSLTLSCEI